MPWSRDEKSFQLCQRFPSWMGIGEENSFSLPHSCMSWCEECKFLINWFSPRFSRSLPKNLHTFFIVCDPTSAKTSHILHTRFLYVKFLSMLDCVWKFIICGRFCSKMEKKENELLTSGYNRERQTNRLETKATTSTKCMHINPPDDVVGLFFFFFFFLSKIKF